MRETICTKVSDKEVDTAHTAGSDGVENNRNVNMFQTPAESSFESPDFREFILICPVEMIRPLHVLSAMGNDIGRPQAAAVAEGDPQAAVGGDARPQLISELPSAS